MVTVTVDLRIAKLESQLLAAEKRIAAAECLADAINTCACQPDQLAILFEAHRDDEFLSEAVQEFDCRNSCCPLLRRPNGQMWKSCVKVLLSKCKAIFRSASSDGHIDCGPDSTGNSAAAATCARVLRLVARLPEMQPLSERPLGSTLIDALLAVAPPATLALALAPGTRGAKLGVAIIERALLGVSAGVRAGVGAGAGAGAGASIGTDVLPTAYTPHANTVLKVLECFIAADMGCGGGGAGEDEHENEGGQECGDADEEKGSDAAARNSDSVFCAALLPPRWAWVRYVRVVLDSHWHWSTLSAQAAGQSTANAASAATGQSSASGAGGLCSDISGGDNNSDVDDGSIVYPPRAHEGTRWLQGSRAAVLQIALTLSLADEDDDENEDADADADADDTAKQILERQHTNEPKSGAGASLTPERLLRELVACGQWKWAESLVESGFEAAGVDLDGDGGINASARDLVNAGGSGGATTAPKVRGRPDGEALTTFLRQHTDTEPSHQHEGDGSDAGALGNDRALQAARRLSLSLLAHAHGAQRRVLASRYAQRFGITHEHAPWFVSDERRANEAQLEKLLGAATPAISVAASAVPAASCSWALDHDTHPSGPQPQLPPFLIRAARFAGADALFQRQVLVSMVCGAAAHVRAALLPVCSRRAAANSRAGDTHDAPLPGTARAPAFPASAEHLLSHAVALHGVWSGHVGGHQTISDQMAAEAEPPIDRTTLHELCEARISAVHSCRAPAPEVVSSASGPGAAALKSNDAVHPEALGTGRYLEPPDDSRIVMVQDATSLWRAALELLGAAGAAETCALLGRTSVDADIERPDGGASDGGVNGGGVTVLGLDAEWPPVLKHASKGSTSGQPSPSTPSRHASTLQLASGSRAWIFDLFALFGARGVLQAPHVAGAADALLVRVLRSPDILRLGWGWDHDAGVLRHSYPERDCFAPRTNGTPTGTKSADMLPGEARVVELAQVAAAAAAAERRAIDACVRLDAANQVDATTVGSIIGGAGAGADVDAGAATTGGSLASTVQQWLGLPLDKRQQCSAWGQRPLTRAQVRYAALDAQVLVWVHTVCTETERAATAVLRKFRQRADTHQHPCLPPPRPHPCSMPALNAALGLPPIGFVVDPNGPVRAARWLRTMGVDVVILRDPNAAPDAASADAAKWERIALEANPHRVLLAVRVRTSRSRAEQQRIERVAGGGVFTLGSSSEPRRQFDEIVRHFGLTFDPDEFMSRCAVCNGHGFVHVTAEEVARRDAAPAKVVAEVKDFWACRQCEKIYWEGPQFLEAHERFGDAFKLKGDEQWEARIKTQRAQQLLAAHRAATAAAPAAPGTREDEWQQFKFSEARTSRMETGAWH